MFFQLAAVGEGSGLVVAGDGLGGKGEGLVVSGDGLAACSEVGELAAHRMTATIAIPAILIPLG